MSLALKFSSLAIRTLSKPIANFIKRQAREHEGFKQTCITFAQSLHRVDMRWRIGLLQDAAAIEKQATREAAQDAAKKHRHQVPTVKTEAQSKADEEAATKATKEAKDDPDSKPRPKPKIRPLSEAKAIDAGASFISETFLFTVAASLILFESWRSRRKESNRRDDVADRLNDLEESERAARRALVELERELLVLRTKDGKGGHSTARRILPPEVYETEAKDEEKADEITKNWLTRVASYMSSHEPRVHDDTESAEMQKNWLQRVVTYVSNKEPQPDDELPAPGPAETIIAESDKALSEKQHQRAIEAAIETSKKPKESSH